MKLTTKGRYAVTAMLDLALRTGSGPVTLAEIARRQDLSLPYLEQLFAKLRQAGLVRSHRGPGGGYVLGHRAEAISMADIITAVDEPVATTKCSGTFDCQGEQRCLTHHLWATLSGHIHHFLSSVTLANLAVRKGVLEVARRQDRRNEPAPAEQLVSLPGR